jgi:hypothetical protein
MQDIDMRTFGTRRTPIFFALQREEVVEERPFRAV